MYSPLHSPVAVIVAKTMKDGDSVEARGYTLPAGRVMVEFKDKDGNVVASIKGGFEEIVAQLKTVTANLLYMPVTFDW